MSVVQVCSLTVMCPELQASSLPLTTLCCPVRPYDVEPVEWSVRVRSELREPSLREHHEATLPVLALMAGHCRQLVHLIDERPQDRFKTSFPGPTFHPRTASPFPSPQLTGNIRSHLGQQCPEKPPVGPLSKQHGLHGCVLGPQKRWWK